MTLSAGSRLGPYEVIAVIGAGGMGEVYRARDTRLGREVAVKVLQEAFTRDPDRRRRFEGEVRSASALSDPHLVTVFDVGEADGVLYFACELVDGSDLRRLLGEGAVPARKALQLAEQIASGLAAAHEKGIVHRDLKPENVLVTRSGLAKIADFGLAKLTQPGADDESQVPTSDGHQTTAGIVMGTASYMSPEQARGAPVDFRSDQFAFGSIVYELLTGHGAFRRGSTAETLAAILREEPEPLATRAPGTPAPLRWIVERCLSKDPVDRYASTRDLARDLRDLHARMSEASSVSGPAGAFGPPGGAARTARTAGIAAGLVAGVAIGALGYWLVTDRAPQTSSVPLFRRLTFQRGNVLHARFAPDGQTVLYGASWEGRPVEIFSTRVDGTESRPLGIANADLAAVSGSGELLLLRKPHFLPNLSGIGTLSRASLAGGAPRDVAENVHGADWLPGGTVVMTRHDDANHALEFPPGTRRLDQAWSPPRVSIDGRHVAVAHGTPHGDSEIVVLDAEGRQLWRADGGFEGMAWHPSGEPWLSRSTGENPGIFALGRGKPARPVLKGTGWILHDIARDGRLLLERVLTRRSLRVRAAGDPKERELSWLDGSSLAGLSGDCGSLLFSEENEAGVGSGGVYLRKTDGSPAVRLADGQALAFSEDGRWAFVRGVGPSARHSFVPSGAGEPIPVDLGQERVQSAVFLPGPEPRLVVTIGGTPESWHLELVSRTGRRPLRIPVGSFIDSVAVSPDGRSIVFGGAGEHGITLCELESGNCRKARIESREYLPVQWSADGRFLYLSDAGEIPVNVVRYEIATGAHEKWLALGPEDPTAFIAVGSIRVSRDGRSYAYDALEVRDSSLILAEGFN